MARPATLVRGAVGYAYERGLFSRLIDQKQGIQFAITSLTVWDKEALAHGLETPLMGDLHKMRTDLLKHRSVATARNTGRCELLDWFASGDVMHLTLHHVMDFLHHLDVWCLNLQAAREWVAGESLNSLARRTLCLASSTASGYPSGSRS